MDNNLPELESVEAFADYLYDDDRGSFTTAELVELADALDMNRHEVRLELESYGLSLTNTPRPKVCRGINSNPHDRWFGPGSSPTHGGSGIDPTTGTANSRAPYRLDDKKVA